MAAVQRWRDGATGVPFVDAHMRELRQKGMLQQFRSLCPHLIVFSLALRAQQNPLDSEQVSADYGRIS